MLKRLYRSKKMILNLALSDFKLRFSGSYFGLFWAIIQPLMTILVFWFVFQIGFRAQSISNVPFILWLISGMVPWNFFQDGWTSGTYTFTSYSFLVKKVIFDIAILPVIKVTSAFIMNIFFHFILILIFILYKKMTVVAFIYIIYYNVCLYMLILSLSFITSVINVFFRDMTQILGIILQFGIWMTPIMWMESMVPAEYLWIFKLNPMYYIVVGYRQALLNNILIYDSFWNATIFFWLKVSVLLIIGIYFYKKSKPHFADVL